MTEVIEVREDERFDETRLAEWLAVNVETELPVTVHQFGGGRANLTYQLTFDNGEQLVLRRPPLGPVAPGSHDMVREYSVLSRLWEGFPLAPRALALCEDEEVIGAPFFLMERRHGVVVREEVPDVFGGGDNVDINRRLSEVVVDTLATFHTVDPDHVGLGSLGHPQGFVRRQVEGWIGRREGAMDETDLLADEIERWLLDRIPDETPPTLIHNDWRLDNMAVSPDDPSTAVAVYDWDMCTRGDPRCDLGTLLASWHDRDEIDDRTTSLMPVGVPGWAQRHEAIERYVNRSGVAGDGIGWFVVFGTWKMGVILQQIFIRWQRGQTEDERFTGYGDAAHRLWELAADRRRQG